MGQTRALNVTPFLTTGIYAGLALLLWMPLIISSSTLFPFVVGKAFYARTLIEAIVALWLVLLITTPRYRPPRSWILLAFGIYTSVALLSAVLGVNFTHSFWSDYERMSGVWDLIHWFFLALVAASVLRSARAWRYLLSWNLAVVLTLGLLALSQVFGVPKLSYLEYLCRVDATLGNTSYLAAILAVMAFVAVGLLAGSMLPAEGADGAIDASESSNGIGREKRWLQGFWLVVCGLALWVLFQTGTRGALVGLVAGLLAMPLAAAMFNRRILRPVASAAGGILLACVVIFGFDLAVGLPSTAGCNTQTPSQPKSLQSPSVNCLGEPPSTLTTNRWN